MSVQEMRGVLARDIAAVLQHPSVSAPDILHDFTQPPLNIGHLSLPCFRLAKHLDEPSQEVAKRLAEKLTALGDTRTYQVSAAGPYLNVRWKIETLYCTLVDEVLQKKDHYGSDSSGSGRVVVLEYGSPNIGRPLAFTNLRSTLIGNTLANCYGMLGYRTERICFVGDWGGQFARLLAAVELWGDREKIARGGATAVDHLADIQNKYQKVVETDSAPVERAKRCYEALESKDPKTGALWRQVRDISLAEVENTLRRLQIRFDHVEGESAYVDGIPAMLEEVKQRSGARNSDGAWIVDVEGCPTPALLQKKDGTSLYLSRDLAAAMDRQHRFHADHSYYVVGDQHRLHFQLLFGVLTKMGHAWAAKSMHVPFGATRLVEKAGRVSTLDQVLDEARERARQVYRLKNPELPSDVQSEAVAAEKIGVAAVVFMELAEPRAQAFDLSWETALAPDGDTGPYVQAAVVRCRQLGEKAFEKGEMPQRAEVPPADFVFGAEEETLVVQVARFGAVLHQVVHTSEPFYLTQYLIELAKSFNRFYYRFPVLQANDAAQRRMRLSLVEATRQTLSNGLRLLGIDCPRQM